MKLTTENLIIIPLTPEEFELLLVSQAKLEEALGLNFSGQNLDEETQKAMEWLYGLSLIINDDNLWYTNWQIILKSANISIGSACFVGGPNEIGEVTLGYGINQDFRGKGYMTEAATAMCNWALAQVAVKKVLAETDKVNESSKRVLEKIGMKIVLETKDRYTWALVSEKNQ